MRDPGASVEFLDSWRKCNCPRDSADSVPINRPDNLITATVRPDRRGQLGSVGARVPVCIAEVFVGAPTLEFSYRRRFGAVIASPYRRRDSSTPAYRISGSCSPAAESAIISLAITSAASFSSSSDRSFKASFVRTPSNAMVIARISSGGNTLSALRKNEMGMATNRVSAYARVEFSLRGLALREFEPPPFVQARPGHPALPQAVSLACTPPQAPCTLALGPWTTRHCVQARAERPNKPDCSSSGMLDYAHLSPHGVRPLPGACAPAEVTGGGIGVPPPIGPTVRYRAGS